MKNFQKNVLNVGRYNYIYPQYADIGDCSAWAPDQFLGHAGWNLTPL
jgi:hypothetical protein